MEIITTRPSITQWSHDQQLRHAIVGLVPTMGALHEGHMELVKQARQTCDVVICSIFVNPTQFNQSQDLDSYPRMPAADLAMLEAHGCDAVFLPSVEDMYGGTSNAADAKRHIVIQFPGLDDVLEGAHRPGHFSGVAQVVSKLFHLIQPQQAFFGQKDFQQLAIIQRMVQALDFPTRIVPVPTVREDDGLAKSSRNLRLSSAERTMAQAIPQAQQQAMELYKAGQLPAAACEIAGAKWLTAPDMKLEYLQLTWADDLTPMTQPWVQAADQIRNGRPAAIVVACWVGQVRLIDNMALLAD